MASLAVLYSILCIQFMVLHFSTSYASPSCHPHESSALLRFKSSFTIADIVPCDESHARTWKNGTDCCSRDGITCDTMSGHVIDLDLSCSQLQGQPLVFVLDLQMNKFSGVLPNHLGLGLLQILNLNRNQFEGPLPRSLAHRQTLRVLDVGNNMIYDTFPNWLESLPQLRVLILRANKFHGFIKSSSGTVPTTSFNLHVKSRILNKTRHPFPKLTIFYVSNKKVGGPLPKKYIENLEAIRNATKEANKISQYMIGGPSSYYVSIELIIKGIDAFMNKVLEALATIDLSQNMFEGELEYWTEAVSLTHFTQENQDLGS